MKKRIYIAGKVTGEEREVCWPKFQKVKFNLEALGYEVINPLEVVCADETCWDTAMKKCIAALMTCDMIYLLSDWRESKGAKIEHKLAKSLNIEILNKPIKAIS